MTLLDARAEWVTAGGFHALCRAHGATPRVASLVEQRRTDADGHPGWWRIRIQGTAAGPARWMASWMPGAWWDAKFSETSSLSSFAWAARHHGPTILHITRWWGRFRPDPGSFLADWGLVLPAFRQRVLASDGLCWEQAWAVCRPDAWRHLPPVGTRQQFVWTMD